MMAYQINIGKVIKKAIEIPLIKPFARPSADGMRIGLWKKNKEPTERIAGNK